ncbi:hypothetical protein NEF87_002228 [Candidatus Lokiarchaeum ossiferum]|uniref:Uncharacterized protein n=1 Tax=Candidatus Lokiarchaeum ossiferum TaxID=2951803 RepID=A0ABY6HR11_9ARCH|nr:hypothetical protein NEF87_002228 [Candidatus Lokiarchaeum sp. B-35]
MSDIQTTKYNNIYKKYHKADFGKCDVCGRAIPAYYLGKSKFKAHSLQKHHVCLKDDKAHIQFYMDTDDDYVLYETYRRLRKLRLQFMEKYLFPVIFVALFISWTIGWGIYIDERTRYYRDATLGILMILLGILLLFIGISIGIFRSDKARAILGDKKDSAFSLLKERTILIQNPLLKLYVKNYRPLITTNECTLCGRPIPAYYLSKKRGYLPNLQAYNVCLNGDSQHLQFYLEQDDKHLTSDVYRRLSALLTNFISFIIFGCILFPLAILICGIASLVLLSSSYELETGIILLLISILLSIVDYNLFHEYLEYRKILGYFDRERYQTLKERYLFERKTFYIGDKRNRQNLDQIPTEIRMKRLENLFEVSNNVKINDVAQILGLSRIELITTLLDNKDNLSGFKLEQDTLIISNAKDLTGFMLVLDKDFQDWENNESSNQGKVSTLEQSKEIDIE